MIAMHEKSKGVEEAAKKEALKSWAQELKGAKGSNLEERGQTRGDTSQDNTRVCYTGGFHQRRVDKGG